MNQLINDIFTELKVKHGITKFEIEHIVDSQFKLLQNTIESRTWKPVSLIHLGKFKPTKYILYKNNLIIKDEVVKEI
jgi:nucleoid DNA-binding protein